MGSSEKEDLEESFTEVEQDGVPGQWWLEGVAVCNTQSLELVGVAGSPSSSNLQGDFGGSSWVGSLQVAFSVSLSNSVAHPVSFLVHSFCAQITYV